MQVRVRLIVHAKFHRGDTIVEVLFAIAVFSFVMMAILQIMQQGAIATQTSLEINLARNQMNSQAEAIRFINASQQSRRRTGEAGDTSIYSQLWSYLKTNFLKTSASNWEAMTSKGGVRAHCIDPTTVSRAFVIDIKNLGLTDDTTKAVKYGNQIVSSVTYPRLVYSNTIDDNNKISAAISPFTRSEGLWVEMVKSSENNTSIAYDFHVRACWEITGNATPLTLGTILRVYEVKGN